MIDRILKVVAVILFAVVVALGSHLYTMTHLVIETDGNGDSAFVTCLGNDWFYGINGFEVG